MTIWRRTAGRRTRKRRHVVSRGPSCSGRVLPGSLQRAAVVLAVFRTRSSGTAHQRVQLETARSAKWHSSEVPRGLNESHRPGSAAIACVKSMLPAFHPSLAAGRPREPEGLEGKLSEPQLPSWGPASSDHGPPPLLTARPAHAYGGRTASAAGAWMECPAARVAAARPISRCASTARRTLTAPRTPEAGLMRPGGAAEAPDWSVSTG